jgi:hypothetical protein
LTEIAVAAASLAIISSMFHLSFPGQPLKWPIETDLKKGQDSKAICVMFAEFTWPNDQLSWLSF